jgi:AcrR family transcriptional regulator
MAVKRAYNKQRRAEGEAQTRSRIVDALMELHEEIGPARTTVSAVAERAGVERLTVYRHFGTEADMLRACSSRWAELHPPPVIDAKSVRGALQQIYAWYRENQRMLTQVTHDIHRVESLDEMLSPMGDYLDEVVEMLEARSPRRRKTLRHALEFQTWQSLARLTRSDREAATLAASWLD